ncbi:hypothetical protein ACJX0J_027354 [Zea mays]
MHHSLYFHRERAVKRHDAAKRGYLTCISKKHVFLLPVRLDAETMMKKVPSGIQVSIQALSIVVPKLGLQATQIQTNIRDMLNVELMFCASGPTASCILGPYK